MLNRRAGTNLLLIGALLLAADPFPVAGQLEDCSQDMDHCPPSFPMPQCSPSPLSSVNGGKWSDLIILPCDENSNAKIQKHVWGSVLKTGQVMLYSRPQKLYQYQNPACP